MKKGWEIKALGDICTFRPPKSEARDRLGVNDPVSFVPMSELGINQKYFLAKETTPLSQVAGSYTYFADGDVLLAKITPCFENGKLGVADGLTNGVGFGSSEFFVIRPGHTLDKEFLYYFLSQPAVRQEGQRCMGGAVGQQRVPKEYLESLTIPVPPLPEQRRIVAILDEAFEGIAAAKANAEKTLRNATGLLEQWLDSTLTQSKAGWRHEQLADVCDVIRGSSPRPIKQFFTDDDNGVNWVKIADATRSGKYISETAQKITPKGAEKSRQVFPGDLLLTNSMSYGHPFIMATDGYVHDGWFVLRNYSDVFDSEFFYAVLTSKVVQRQFGVLAAGSVVKNISSDLVKKARLPIPPKKEQVALVKIFLSLQEQGADYEEICRSKDAALDELKASLLHQAFTGQL